MHVRQGVLALEEVAGAADGVDLVEAKGLVADRDPAHEAPDHGRGLIVDDQLGGIEDHP